MNNLFMVILLTCDNIRNVNSLVFIMHFFNSDINYEVLEHTMKSSFC